MEAHKLIAILITRSGNVLYLCFFFRVVVFDSETGTDRYIFTYRSGDQSGPETDDSWRVSGPTWATIKHYLIVAGSVLGAILHGIGGVALAYRCKLCTKHRFLGGFFGGATVMLLNLGIRALRDYVQKSETRRARRAAADPECGGANASDVSLNTQTAKDLVRVLEEVRACFEADADAEVTPLRARVVSGRARRFGTPLGSRVSTPVSVACPRAPQNNPATGGGSSPVDGSGQHAGAARVLGDAGNGRRMETFSEIELAPIVH